MELQDPMVAFSIFSSVTIPWADMSTSHSGALEYVAISKRVHDRLRDRHGGVLVLVILPISSRGNVFHDIKGYLLPAEDVLQAQNSL